MSDCDEDDDDCQKAVRVVYQYLDGELGSERVDVEAHLRRCRGCSSAVEFERVFLLRVRAACPERHTPDGLLDKIRELLRSADDG